MLKRADKEALVDGLRKDISEARGVFLTNMIGIPSNDSVSIRKQVRESQGKVVVAKNTLLKRAAEGTSFEKVFENLKGPHALAFAFEDAPGVAKVLKKAAKDHEVIEFKGGMLGGEELTVAQINELADLPSREEMLGTLLATFQAPVSAFARVLNAIKDKKEEGADAAPVEAAEATAEATTEEKTEE